MDLSFDFSGEPTFGDFSFWGERRVATLSFRIFVISRVSFSTNIRMLPVLGVS